MSSSPRSSNCLVCDKALGAEPHWLTDSPRGVHDRCRDWSKERWPEVLDKRERRLRVL